MARADGEVLDRFFACLLLLRACDRRAGLARLPLEGPGMALKIYLAGPDVFLPDGRAIGRRKQERCRAFGFEGLFPLDNDAYVGGDALQLFRANCALMEEADAGIFNLTPFRGPSADAGTLFELGFMFARRTPVYGYTSDPRLYRERVAATFGMTEGTEPRRDRDGNAVEDFGWRDNLMIIGAIEDAGGRVAAAAEPGTATPALAAFAAFEDCLKAMQDRFGRSEGG